MASVEELLVRIDASTEQLRREMRRADQTVDQAGKRIDRSLSRVDKSFDRLNRAAGFAAKAIGGYLGVLSVRAVVGFAGQQLAAADAIGKAADNANVGTAAIQELRYAFTQLASVSDKEVDVSLRRFNRRLGLAREAAGPAKAAFQDMFGGVEQFETTEQALDAVIERLASMEDGSRRAALASAFFGDDAGPVLAAALGKGSAAVNQLRQDARDLGLVLDDDVIQNADKIRSEFDKAQRILNTSFMSALNEATPLLVSMANSAAKIARGLSFSMSGEGKLYKELQDLTQQYTLLERKREQFGDNFVAEAYSTLGDFGSNEEVDAAIARLKAEADRVSAAIDEIVAGKDKPRPINIGTIGGFGGGGDDPLGDEYAKLVASLERQIALMGSAGEASKMRYDLEHGALKDLDAAQKAHLMGLARASDLARADAVATQERIDLYMDLEERLYAVPEITEDANDAILAQLKAIEAAAQQFGRNFEDSIIEAARTGKFEMKAFTAAVLEDLARIELRRALMGSDGKSGLMGMAGSFLGGLFTANADGNAFYGGRVIPFARGGVVDSPTLFPMAGGTGLMGEAGPEAIMPLKRGPDGKLGVQAAGGGGLTINVNQHIDARGQGQEQVEKLRNTSRESAQFIISTVATNIRRNGEIRQALAR